MSSIETALISSSALPARKAADAAPPRRVASCQRNPSGDPARRAWCEISGKGAGLVQLLATQAHALSSDEHGGVQITRERSPLSDIGSFDSDEESFAYLDVTLWPAVREAARACGVELLDDFDEWDGLSLRKFASRSSLVDRAAIEMIEQYGRGIIRHSPSANPAGIAARLAAAFSSENRRIVIVASTREQCSEVMWQLRNLKVKATRIASGRVIPVSLPNVIVATPIQLPRACAISRIDLYIAVDALEALNAGYGLDPPARSFDLSRSSFSKWKRHLFAEPWPPERSFDPTQPTRPALLRRVGLLSTDKTVAKNEWGRLYRAFGFPQVVVFPEGCEPPQVSVEWIRLRRVRLACQTSHDSSHRHGIWRNHVRHRKLAAIARAEATKGRHVLVLVASPEQAAAIAQYLPDWAVRLSERADVASFGKKLAQQLKHASAQARGPRLIATLSSAIPVHGDRNSLSVGDFDVVIRASGGQGLIPLLSAEPGVSSVIGQRVKLIDCDDRFHPVLRKDARRRAREYAEASWFAAETDPVVERAKLFVEGCTKQFENYIQESR